MFKKQKSATLLMIQQYIHVHQILKKATLKLSNDTHLILNWFRINSMVVNPGKFQITFLGSNIDNSKITFMIENKRVKSRSEVKLLGITIDDKLSFTKHSEN